MPRVKMRGTLGEGEVWDDEEAAELGAKMIFMPCIFRAFESIVYGGETATCSCIRC